MRLCTVVELDTAGFPIENAVSDVGVGTDSAGTSVDGDATTSVTITNSFDESNNLLTPTSLSIAVATSESSGSFSQSRTNGNTTYTVTASSSGLTSVSCAVKK